MFQSIVILWLAGFCTCVSSYTPYNPCAYQCLSDEACISRHQRCNGIADCQDESDEKNCDSACDIALEFPCHDERGCISIDWKCDGDADCSDRSDEEDCDQTPIPLTKCRIDEFRCRQPSSCIPRSWQCDGSTDCADGSDEYEALCGWISQQGQLSPALTFSVGLRNLCTDGYICKTSPSANHSREHKCIPLNWLCDGVADCDERDDEQELICASPIHDDTTCRADQGRYLCDDSSACLTSDQVCDGHIDCKDKSDEHGIRNGEVVPEKSCIERCVDADCPSSCFSSPLEAHCICPSGYKYQATSGDSFMKLVEEDTNSTRLVRGACVDIDECEQSEMGLCSQLCVNTVGSYECQCKSGFKLDPSDNFTCRHQQHTVPILVFSTIKEIRMKELDYKEGPRLEAHKFMSIYSANISITNDAVGVAFDDISGRVYWTAVASGHQGIITSTLRGTDLRYALVPERHHFPEDLSLDRSARNLYFTDKGGHYVGVMNVESHNWTILARGVEKPRGIDLHTKLGIMFYTDWGSHPSIWRASMDGENVIPIITMESGLWPNDIVVDVVMNKIYWSEVKQDVIECANLDGSSRKVIMSGPHMHFYSLAIFEDSLFWSDWLNRDIVSCNKFTGKNRQQLVKESHLYPMGISIYAHTVGISALADYDENPCRYIFCSHLCARNDHGTHTCLCPDGMVLNIEDELTCIPAHFRIQIEIDKTEFGTSEELTVSRKHVPESIGAEREVISLRLLEHGFQDKLGEYEIEKPEFIGSSRNIYVGVAICAVAVMSSVFVFRCARRGRSGTNRRNDRMMMDRSSSSSGSPMTNLSSDADDSRLYIHKPNGKRRTNYYVTESERIGTKRLPSDVPSRRYSASWRRIRRQQQNGGALPRMPSLDNIYRRDQLTPTGQAGVGQFHHGFGYSCDTAKLLNDLSNRRRNLPRPIFRQAMTGVVLSKDMIPSSSTSSSRRCGFDDDDDDDDDFESGRSVKSTQPKINISASDSYSSTPEARDASVDLNVGSISEVSDMDDDNDTARLVKS